jgi:serine/threonine-protein kinase
MDHTGTVSALRAAPAHWTSPRFSPDGRRLAIDMLAGQTDLFIYEWTRDTLTRVTFGAVAARPVWTPDGRRIVFRSARDKVINLYWLRADGSGDVQRLTESQNIQTPASWHPSGKFLAFYETNPQTGNDLMILPIEGDREPEWKPGKPTVFLSTPFAEQEPMFSPDGRWIAYHSLESGRAEVYVRPFPGPGGKWQISTEGGTFPTWSRTRAEIFYAGPDSRLMVVPYRVEGDVFMADRPRAWSERRFMPRPGLGSFDLHPDGERFVLAAGPENDNAVRQDGLVFIFNFFEELKRLVPTK